MTCQIHIQAIPKAGRTEIASWDGAVLKIRVKAVPEKGKANQELIEFLAKWLNVPKTAIQLVKGGSSRHKTIQLPLLLETLLKAIEVQLS